MQLFVINHVVNFATLDDEFNKLINYIEYKLFEWDNKKLEAHGGRSVRKGFLSMWTTKCGTLMQLLLWKLNKKNGVCTHCFTSSQQFPLCGPLAPPSLGHITTMRPWPLVTKSITWKGLVCFTQCMRTISTQPCTIVSIFKNYIRDIGVWWAIKIF